MEGRLSGTFKSGPPNEPSPARPAAEFAAPPPAAPPPAPPADEVRDAVPAAGPEIPLEGETPATWPDDAGESAFLAELRDRGESPAPVVAPEERADEVEPKALPALEQLVERIPAEVREVLEELFRARFVNVKRVPKARLKT